MIFLGGESLRRAIHEFVVHYHQERNHQGLENRLIIPMEKTTDTALAIERRQRLGGATQLLQGRMNIPRRDQSQKRIESVHRIASGRPR
jgi:hypothetical protein